MTELDTVNKSCKNVEIANINLQNDNKDLVRREEALRVEKEDALRKVSEGQKVIDRQEIQCRSINEEINRLKFTFENDKQQMEEHAIKLENMLVAEQDTNKNLTNRAGSLEDELYSASNKVSNYEFEINSCLLYTSPSPRDS